MIYFDSAGSFPLLEEVKESLIQAINSHSANPSADHLPGTNANGEIERVREQVANMIGAMPSEIIFTSGATESNNLAIKGLLNTPITINKKHIVTSKIEHKCVLSICNYLAASGYEITYLTPQSDGIISPNDIEKAIRPDTALVSIMHVNNELGTINPIAEIGERCFERNVLFHTDAAQSFGKLGIDVDEMNIDMLSLSAHKIGGMKGIGALYIRDARDNDISPIIHGAGQEQGIRGGTVATPLVLSLGSACEHFPNRYKQTPFNQLKQYLLKQLEQYEVKYLVNGNSGLPHIISLTLPDIDVTTFLLEHRQQFALAQGSACSSKEIEPSYVLKNIGLDRKHAERTLRLSLDFRTSESDINSFTEALKKHR